jgi:hypothetical protein
VILMRRQRLLLPVMLMTSGNRLLVFAYTPRLLGCEPEIQDESGEERAENTWSHAIRLSRMYRER